MLVLFESSIINLLESIRVCLARFMQLSFLLGNIHDHEWQF